MEKDKKKTVWFIVLMLVVFVLEVVVVWGVSWWIGWMLHVPPMPWWLCCSVVFVGNLLAGRWHVIKQKDQSNDGGEE